MKKKVVTKNIFEIVYQKFKDNEYSPKLVKK